MPAQLAGTIFLLWCILGMQGCDKYDQVDCSNNGSTVLHSSGEFCMCAEGYGWMYDYNQEKWRCIGARGNYDWPESYAYGFTFNGIQMGPLNSYYNMSLHFSKSDSTFIEIGLNNRGLQESSAVYIKNAGDGDSIYMRDLRVRHPNRFEFILDGKDCLVTGRGRVSKNKDTLDMTAYIIPWDDYALVESANEIYRDARDIDISKSVDVRKMQFLSARAFPKYAR